MNRGDGDSLDRSEHVIQVQLPTLSYEVGKKPLTDILTESVHVLMGR